MFVVISNLIGHITPTKVIDPNNQVIFRVTAQLDYVLEPRSTSRGYDESLPERSRLPPPWRKGMPRLTPGIDAWQHWQC